MLSYTTERKSYWLYIFKQWLIVAAIYFIIIIYDQFFANDFINITDGFYWIGAGLLTYRFIDLISRMRIYKIVIDANERTITQYYRRLFSGEGEKIYTLSKMQLYINSAAAPASAVTSLKLYKDHREIINLGVKKDGFTAVILQEIGKQLQQLGVPVAASETFTAQ